MRLVLVSNRLPVTAVKKRGSIQFETSPGGLATGLSSYLLSPQEAPAAIKGSLWVGWPGITVPDHSKESATTQLQQEFKAHPVFLAEKEMDKFYHGFCNKIIWPLFHYFPSYVVYEEEYWAHYQQVNQLYCSVLRDVLEPDDVVWIHDYHLMLLPKLLREKHPEVPIGFYLHIPFPTFELFRLMPGRWRKAILEGMLGADLIGFHTHEYAQYFLRSVLLILGLEHNMGRIITDDHQVTVGSFPMGIEFNKYHSEIEDPQSLAERESLAESFGQSKVILSIDRLDYSKGILNRLRGYELFLEKNPHWQNRIVLVMVVVPSRIGVEHYQMMKRRIDEYVGKINGRFGNLQWNPINYQYRALSFDSIKVLYTLSDIALVTPLRDGMNLIAKEYIASRREQTGVLILSEMAGAAIELGEALIINPNDVQEIAEAMKTALEMPVKEQIRTNSIMQDRVRRYDVNRWVGSFIETLLSLQEERKKLNARFLGAYGKEQLLNAYRNAKRKLILLDYDGTLVPFAATPELARPPLDLLADLRSLSEHGDTTVMIVSGRDKKNLTEWFGDINIGIVAEHGVWFKPSGQSWRMITALKNDWKSQVRPVLDCYADLVWGSFVEEKEFSLVWHYRRSDPELSSLRAKELIDQIATFTAKLDVQILQGHKIVEIRNAGVSKGNAVFTLIGMEEYDFILAVGDDWTDEDMFKVLPDSAFSLKVGLTASYAKFNLLNCQEVRDFIRRMIP